MLAVLRGPAGSGRSPDPCISMLPCPHPPFPRSCILPSSHSTSMLQSWGSWAAVMRDSRRCRILQWPGTQLGFPSGKLAGKAKLSDLETEAPRDQLLVLGNSEGLELKVQFSPSVVSDSLRPHVHHHLPEFTQTHIHCVGDAIQPSYLLSSPSSPAPNPSQHQSLFQ